MFSFYTKIKDKDRRLTNTSLGFLRSNYKKIPLKEIKKLPLALRLKYLLVSHDYYMEKVYHNQKEKSRITDSAQNAWEKFDSNQVISGFNSETPLGVIDSALIEKCDNLIVMIKFLDGVTATHQSYLENIHGIF
jgi:hypothetical protein